MVNELFHYEVLVHSNDRSLMVNVFTDTDNNQVEVIKEKSIIEASRLLDDLGVKHTKAELNPVGYKNNGEFPKF